MLLTLKLPNAILFNFEMQNRIWGPVMFFKKKEKAVLIF